MRRLLALAAAGGALLLPAASVAVEPRYCVRPVPIVQDVEGGAAEPQGRIVSRQSQSIAPRYVASPKGADYPLVYDDMTVEKPDGTRERRTLFWHFNAGHELVGPRDTGFAFQTGGPAAGQRDRTFIIGGRYQTALPGEPRWGAQLMQQVAGGLPAPAAPELQRAVAEPRNIAWSNILDGFVISSIEWVRREGKSPIGRNRVTVLRDDGPVALNGVADFALLTDLPRLGVSALLGFSALTLVNRDLETVEVARLNSGDDYNGWDGLYETRDEGWLYADGAQYDNAFHVEKSEGGWRVDRIIRFADDEGVVDAVLRWLFGMNRAQMERDKLSSIVRAGKCRKFSAAIKRMIFCDDMHELRAGKLVPIGDGKVRLAEFLGDAESLGIALFFDRDGGLYAYDGDRLRSLPGPDIARARVQDVAKLKRTFLSAGDALFELDAADRGAGLVRLAVPEPGNLFFTRFLPGPDNAEVVAFTGGGIYLVAGRELRRLWSPADNGRIAVTGHMTPAAGLGGILFATHPQPDGRGRLHLLTMCGAGRSDGGREPN